PRRDPDCGLAAAVDHERSPAGPAQADGGHEPGEAAVGLAAVRGTQDLHGGRRLQHLAGRLLDDLMRDHPHPSSSAPGTRALLRRWTVWTQQPACLNPRARSSWNRRGDPRPARPARPFPYSRTNLPPRPPPTPPAIHPRTI